MQNTKTRAAAGGNNPSLTELAEVVGVAMRQADDVLLSLALERLDKLANLVRRSKARSAEFRRDRTVPRGFRD